MKNKRPAPGEAFDLRDLTDTKNRQPAPSGSFDPRHKPTNSRRNRPAWAANEKMLILHMMKRVQRNITVAHMYWLENKSARDIATHLDMTTEAVKKIIQRDARS
jgi:hypothetical protein